MKKENENKHKKRDLLLIGGILLIAVVFYGSNLLLNRTPAAIVEVSVDGVVVEELDLHTDTELTIQGYNGGTNHLIIREGHAYISEATCPDKVCVHQGKVQKSGEMLVCLPNRMIAKIVGE